MSKLKNKFLTDYSLETLRDVNLEGPSTKNMFLRFKESVSKWVPSRLSIDFASMKRNPTEEITILADEFLVMKSPDIAEHGIVVEGCLDII